MSPLRGSVRERADRLRAISLEAVLACLGAEQDLHDRAKWHTAQGPVSVTPPKFMNWSRGVGGGGAIDLVIHLEDLGFLAALDWLGRHFPECDTSPTSPSTPYPPTSRGGLVLPPPNLQRLPRIQHYLLEVRGLAAASIRALVEAGTIYADDRANAVFLMHALDGRPIGAELRGTTPQPWRSLARGTRRDRGAFATPQPQPSSVVLCESAIDALSCAALPPGSLCLSPAGARATPRWLAPLLEEHDEVLCGFDADDVGDGAARQMMAHHPAVKRLRPPLKDWNDVLRRQP